MPTGFVAAEVDCGFALVRDEAVAGVVEDFGCGDPLGRLAGFG